MGRSLEPWPGVWTLGPDSLGFESQICIFFWPWAKNLSFLCPDFLSVRSTLRVCLQISLKGIGVSCGLGQVQPLPKALPSREEKGVAG